MGIRGGYDVIGAVEAVIGWGLGRPGMEMPLSSAVQVVQNSKVLLTFSSMPRSRTKYPIFSSRKKKLAFTMIWSSALHHTSMCALHNCYVWCRQLNVTEILSGPSYAHTSCVLFLDGTEVESSVKSPQPGLTSPGLWSNMCALVCFLLLVSFSFLFIKNHWAFGIIFIYSLGSGAFHDGALPHELHSPSCQAQQPGLPRKL